MRLISRCQRFNWGFIGAPIAVAVTDSLLPVGLLIYIRFVAGRGCWPGLTKRGTSLPLAPLGPALIKYTSIDKLGPNDQACPPGPPDGRS